MLEKVAKIAAVVVATSFVTLFEVTCNLAGNMSTMVDTISDIIMGD